MAEEIPSVVVQERAHVNPQFDPGITDNKQRSALNSSFEDFWKQEDAKVTSAPPSAPASPGPADTVIEKKDETPTVSDPEKTDPVTPEPPKHEGGKPPETPEVRDEPKTEVPVTTTPVAATPEPKPVDIDSLEIHPDAPEAQKSQWKQLKDAANSYRIEAKLFRSKLSPLLAEAGLELKQIPEDLSSVLDQLYQKVQTWKTGSLTPEIQSELEGLRTLERSVGVLQSKEFTDQYVEPVNASYKEILNEMSNYFGGDKAENDKFIDTMLKQYTPSQLNTTWWNEQVSAMTKADDIIKIKIKQDIAGLMQLQKKHDVAARDLATNKLSYEGWKQKMEQQGQLAYQQNMMDEVRRIAAEDPDIGGIMPLATDGITDPKQIEAIKLHNQRFQEHDAAFGQLIRDMNEGPRKAARRATEFLKLRELNKILTQSAATKESDFEALKAEKDSEIAKKDKEIESLRNEVKTRRVVADAPLKPSAGAGSPKSEPVKPKLTEVAGLKGLRQSFEKNLPGA